MSSTNFFLLSRRFVFTFALGAGPVPGLLLTEIFPSRIRAKAMAFCMSVHWVISFCLLIISAASYYKLVIVSVVMILLIKSLFGVRHVSVSNADTCDVIHSVSSFFSFKLLTIRCLVPVICCTPFSLDEFDRFCCMV